MRLKAQIYREHFVPIVVIILLILGGYYQLFLGGDFYTYKDQEMISAYSYGNSIGNGWRPDKGFGISFFYGDPGKWHPWSLFSFWEKIAPSQRSAYSWSILFLDILAAVALYLSLRRIIPGLGSSASLLSVLIVFGTFQASISYNRTWITMMIGVPLLLLLLYHYYKDPKVYHLFMASLLFWFVVFFGNFYNFSRLFSLGVFFSILYHLYFKGPLKKFLLKSGLFFFIGISGMVLIGFWAFYSVLVDSAAAGGYMREKMISFPQAVNLVPDIRGALIYIAGLFHIEWLPINLHMLGVWPHEILQSVNISPVFPLIIIYFIFYRSAGFWEFSLKWLLLIFYIFTGLCLIPVFNGIFSFISSTTKTVVTMYDVANLFPLEIILIGIFIWKMREGSFRIEHTWGRRIQKTIAFLLFLFYSALAVFCFFALFAPDTMPHAAAKAIAIFKPHGLGGYSKELLEYVVSSNIYLMQKAMHWHSLAFFLLTALLILPFLRDKWLKACAKRATLFIIVILAINGILLSWTFYPLNNNVRVWDKIAHALPDFKPTDRFYFTDDADGYARLDLPERLARHERRAQEAGGLEKHLAYKVGLYEPPGLNLSSNKSFIQRNVGEFIYHIFNGDGKARIRHLRELTTAGPMIPSELLDMGAVSYYYSTREFLDPPENISLEAETDQLYIYKNLNAWPYFYLADRLGLKEKGVHLKDVRRGTAYLEEDDLFNLPKRKGRSDIELEEFSYGRMVFDYYGDRENFLVVADAWHPFWKARIGEQELPVIKANEIFKGVRLPEGKHILTLFFDTAPFFAGIYISIIAWSLFLTGLVFALRFKVEMPYLK